MVTTTEERYLDVTRQHPDYNFYKQRLAERGNEGVTLGHLNVTSQNLTYCQLTGEICDDVRAILVDNTGDLVVNVNVEIADKYENRISLATLLKYCGTTTVRKYAGKTDDFGTTCNVVWPVNMNREGFLNWDKIILLPKNFHSKADHDCEIFLSDEEVSFRIASKEIYDKDYLLYPESWSLVFKHLWEKITDREEELVMSFLF